MEKIFIDSTFGYPHHYSEYAVIMIKMVIDATISRRVAMKDFLNK